MRALVQRADGAAVRIAGEVTGQFTGPGLCALVGVTHTDTPAIAARCADKVYDLRIFSPARFTGSQLERCQSPGTAPGSELAASDLRLPVLVVSQFTLYGETRKGRRPTWERAAPRALAEPLVDAFAAQLEARGAAVHTGRFGADMAVTLTNDGPVTVMIEVD